MTGIRMEGQKGFPAMSTTPAPSGLALTEPGPAVLCPGWKKQRSPTKEYAAGWVGRAVSEEQLAVS